MNLYTETTIQCYSGKVVHCYYKTAHFVALANRFCPKCHAVMARAERARAVIARPVQECRVGILGSYGHFRAGLQFKSSIVKDEG